MSEIDLPLSSLAYPRARRPWRTLALLLLIGSGLISDDLCAASIRVRGRPVLRSIRTQPTASGGYQLIGYVRDRFDQPLSGQRVVADGVPSQPCEPEADVSGNDGEFCLRVDAPRGTTVRLRLNETEYVTATSVSVTLDPGNTQMGLSIHLQSEELNLSASDHAVGVELEAAGSAKETYPLRLELRNVEAPEARLQRQGQISGERGAQFLLPSEQLGRPGPALLVAEISILDQELARAERKVTLVDTVSLAFAEALQPVRPVRGFELQILAVGSRGPVSSGWIEARVGETTVGTGKVEHGQAEIEVRFQAPRRERLPLSLRYVATDPWYRPGKELDALLEVLPPPWWVHAPWVALAAVAAYWIIRTWRRPGRSITVEQRTKATGEAAVTLIRPSAQADGWTGMVVDAHTLEPVAAAQLKLLAPSLDGIAVLSAGVSEADGTFYLDKVANPPEAARLVVTAASHSELRLPVPPLGELRIALVERRRHLLQALTRWAKARGTPWSGNGQPTPAHIADVASQRDEPETSVWAATVESAAYGPTAPSADDERALITNTPPLDRHAPHKR